VTQTRWLTPDQLRAWVTFLEASQLVGRAVDHQLRTAAGLTHAEYEILARLSEAPEQRLRMGDLAHRLVTPKSRLSYQIDQLAKVGLVRRERCPSDARGLLAALTEEGKAALRRAAPGHVATVRATFVDVLTAEQLDALTDALARVRDHLVGVQP